MSTIRDDPFFQEGQQAAADGAELSDCPHPEGSDGQNGWMIGWRACPLCQQDHRAVFRCQGRILGKLPKNREAMREAALKSHAAQRLKIKEECLVEEKNMPEDQPRDIKTPEPLPDEVGKIESKPTWRW